MKKILVISLLFLSACSWFGGKKEVAQCPAPACPEVLPTKGAKGWPVQNNDGIVWKGVRAGTNFVADKTRPVRREAAKFLIPEDVVTSEADYARFAASDAQYKVDEQKLKAASKKTYCYSSIGVVNCYKEPIEGAEDRLME